MSTNSSKLIIGLILGLVIGVVGGFLYFDPQLQELDTDISHLNGELASTDAELTDISAEYSELNEDYENLQDDYNDLVVDKVTIENNYLGIESVYNELLDDYELLVASLPLSPQQVSGTTLEREYEWYFSGKKYELSLSIPETQYEYYKGLERISDSDYSVYVTHPYDDEFINTVVRKFNFIALAENLTEEEKINLVISYVQSLPYTVDSVTTAFDEYPRYPLETLIDNGGDCEDTSILAASLLKSMNYDIILIAPPEHMAVGVNIDAYGDYWIYEGEKYFYLETTGEGWEIGEYPDDFEDTASLYALNPVPMCVQNWTAQWNGRNKIDVTITATNLGSAIADDFQISAAFDAGDDYIWNREESVHFDLNIGKSITFTLTLDVPENENTRLIINILDTEGWVVDRSYSEWFDT